ncbi:gluconeogenesis factor YvcK family protein [Paeniglutamicibacter cryotolerans]|uniref:Putative gluconeogenesis factor n=1 Tax=Paeniglutamicibacter cryotolerans TaxID=670079 RepID=A0A839QM81_9MICC|nr:uridine diphosphate-N-acetylglucosamine-binding protein YvcK [Paeniglutamicibacter cryotolerans]MBB2996870.1 putative cofD-like protein [Paeniglutamicibacter cryotolerans]
MPILPPLSGRDDAPVRVVALGGGHGLSASLSALRRLTSEITAVVTVADDGGSSGKLRDELDVLPPGDLRMALAALCDDTDWGRTWRDVMQHRFSSKPESAGSLDQHAVGNLLIVALWELLQDPVAGLRWAGALLGARGQVLPMSTVPLTISGDVLEEGANGELVRRRIRGQASLASAGSSALVANVSLEPRNAPACAEALEAIELADWVVLGPGSWYTSVLPHLLLPEMRHALETTPARRLLTMNLATETNETAGLDAAAHLEVIARYAPDLRLDAILADPDTVGDLRRFEAAAARLGARCFFGRVGVGTGRAVHDPLRLAAAYHDVFTTYDSDEPSS